MRWMSDESTFHEGLKSTCWSGFGEGGGAKKAVGSSNLRAFHIQCVCKRHLHTFTQPAEMQTDRKRAHTIHIKTISGRKKWHGTDRGQWSAFAQPSSQHSTCCFLCQGAFKEQQTPFLLQDGKTETPIASVYSAILQVSLYKSIMLHSSVLNQRHKSQYYYRVTQNLHLTIK